MYCDTHAHLDVAEFNGDREQVITRARESGVGLILCPGITAESSEAVLRLAECFSAVHAAVGIQANYCGEASTGDWDRIVAMSRHQRVVALGETGLDNHWDFTPPSVQQDYFDRHLRLAQDLGLPVIIHCREAEDDIIPMLREAVSRGPLRGVVHAFSGDQAMARACVELGLHVSFAGSVTYTNKKFKSLLASVAEIPADRILIETDSPYLVPHPLRGKQRRNEPANVLHTARCLAELCGVTVEEMASRTTANALRLFQLG